MSKLFSEQNEIDYESVIHELNKELEETKRDLSRYKDMYYECVVDRIPEKEYANDCSKFWRGGILSAVISACLTTLVFTSGRTFDPVLVILALVFSGIAIFISAALRIFFIDPKMGNLKSFWYFLVATPLILLLAMYIRDLP